MSEAICGIMSYSPDVASLIRATGLQMGTRAGRDHPRLADHRPEHGPRVPWPVQLPPPELPCSLPLPLPLEPPDETLTVTAPLLDTLPETPAGPEMTPLLMLTPTLVLGSHEPRVVWIETLQLPSKEAASAAVAMAATAITAASTRPNRSQNSGSRHHFHGHNLQR